METGVGSVADSDNKNTSTPWKLRFIKSHVVSSPACKQVDSGFELFVSGLQEKISPAEHSLKNVSEGKLPTDSIKQREVVPCDDIGYETTLLLNNTDKEITSANVSSNISSQTSNTLSSAKLWKPVAASYGSFIVLDETIAIDESDEDDSFKKYDESFSKNVSGIIPLNETAKRVYSPKFGSSNSGNVSDLGLMILDEADENEVRATSTVSEKNVLQDILNVSPVATDQSSGEDTVIEMEKNVNIQNNHSDSAEAEKTDYASSTLTTQKQELNATIEQFQHDIGKNKQLISADKEAYNLEQVISDNEESGTIVQVKSNCRDTEKTKQIKPSNEKTGKVELVKSDNMETQKIAPVKSESGYTGKLKFVDTENETLEQVKPDSGETGKVAHTDNLETEKIVQVKSKSEETEKVKAGSGKIEKVSADSGKIKKVKAESGKIEKVKTEEVKAESGEIDEVMSDDVEIGKIQEVKSDNQESGKVEQVKSDSLGMVKMEHVKPDSGEFVSSDPEENADNNNPEWELLKKLETDEERYKAVRLRWRNLVIPNPNKNLTYRSRGYSAPDKNQKQVLEVKQNPVVASRKRTHSADPIEHHVPAKRQRTFSCTEIFDRKMVDIHKNLSRERNTILQQHERAVQSLTNKTNYELRNYPPGSFQDERIRALHVQNVVDLRYKCDNRLAAVESESMNQLRTLEKAMEEVRVFNTFYQGLEEGCDDALFLTDEQLMEVLEEDHLYECFTKFYNG